MWRFRVILTVNMKLLENSKQWKQCGVKEQEHSYFMIGRQTDRLGASTGHGPWARRCPQVSRSMPSPLCPGGHSPTTSQWAEWDQGRRGPCQAMPRQSECQGSGSGQVSPPPGQAWGQVLGLWGAPEHGGRPPPRPLLTPSHTTPAWSLDGDTFLGPDLLAASFLCSTALREETLESFVYSFWTTVIHPRNILVLLWST